MRTRHTVPFFFALTLVALSTGCSSAPSQSSRYMNLDYDTKTVFVTYYPFLNADQREEFLANSDKSPRQMIQDWAGQFNDPEHRLRSFDEMMANPANRKISTVEIRLDQAEPITAGDKARATAIATYANGRQVDITPDTEWKVEPHLATLDRNELSYECADSDLTLTASFLGEKEASKPVTIRKPLESLEITTADSSIGVDSGYSFQLKLVAHCKDGSSSDVSCQALWKSIATGGKIQGCGNFIVTSKELLAEEALTVTATYGNLSVRKILQSPIR